MAFLDQFETTEDLRFNLFLFPPSIICQLIVGNAEPCLTHIHPEIFVDLNKILRNLNRDQRLRNSKKFK